MLPICEDMVLKIGTELSDREKIRLTMVSKLMNKLKYKFTYHEKVNIKKMVNLPYFDNFECIKIKYTTIYPKNVKFIYFNAHEIDIPQYVTHLTVNWDPELSIGNNIPSSVTHLTFGNWYNRTQPIKDNIPSSVTHLTFGDWFNQTIQDCVPNFITHLILGRRYEQEIIGVPSSVIEISIAGDKEELYVGKVD